MTTSQLRNSDNRSPLRRGLLLIPLLLGCFALSPTAEAVVPAPDGGYPGNNTAEGHDALFSLTTGVSNTAVGLDALYYNNTGSQNTATGFASLFKNTAGMFNTADGFRALFSNTTGHDNTANGVQALFSNTIGSMNTANGVNALYANSTGSQNTATGVAALKGNQTGEGNTANGYQALFHNHSGGGNTACGQHALFGNTAGGANTASGVNALLSNDGGDFNTAIGFNALNINTAGNNNIALGFSAGSTITGDNNIDIGSTGGNGESGTIRIGQLGSQTRTFIAGISGVSEGSPAAVFINTTTGQLGTQPPASSRRYKKEIRRMDKTSEAILALKPVTFQYKSDNKGLLQFGLIAEEVARVNPALVLPDNEGKPYTVRYDAVNAMLLNEFLKEHRKVEEQAETIAKLTSAVAQQRRDFQATIAKLEESVTARLQEQSAQIQKVSAQLAAASPSGGGLEASKAAPQVVNNP